MIYTRGSLGLFFFRGTQFKFGGATYCWSWVSRETFIGVASNYSVNYDTLNFQSREVMCVPTVPGNHTHNNIFYMFLPLWNSLLFKGKSYRIRFFKKFNKITFSLGYSHPTKIILNPHLLTIFKLRRQRFLFFCTSVGCYKLFKTFIHTYRQVNPYTQRGLRLSRQPIVKRFGKISQAFSGLH